MAAIDPEIQGPDRLRQVFARVKAGDNRVADLYSEDGVIQVLGQEIVDREAIRTFYQQTIDGIHPQPEVREVLKVENLYIAVVHVPNDYGVQNTSTSSSSTTRASDAW